MARLAAPRRAALTGYPLQNNLDEYYAMICWVQPELMGTPAEFKVRGRGLWVPKVARQGVDTYKQALRVPRSLEITHPSTRHHITQYKRTQYNTTQTTHSNNTL